MNSQHPDSGVDTLWLAKRQEKKAARRNREQPKPILMITSLMDAFTIILVFLLKSFGSDPVQIRESDDMKLPRTTSEKTLEDAVVIGISTKAIQVDDRKVADLRNGMIDESLKRDGAEGLLINPLFDQLQERVQHLKMVAARTGSEFKSKALIVADKGTNYRVITEVLYTAGQAEFNNFLFVAAEGSKQE